jgi:hypothetical protein
MASSPQQFTSNIQYEQFQRLVEYYGMTQCVFPVGIQVHEKKPVSSESKGGSRTKGFLLMLVRTTQYDANCERSGG